jgi:hypothetical protein
MPRSTEVKVDMGLLAKVEALPVRRSGAPAMVPTKEQLEALRLYWKSGRRQTEISRAIGVCTGVARGWYREYVETGEPRVDAIREASR